MFTKRTFGVRSIMVSLITVGTVLWAAEAGAQIGCSARDQEVYAEFFAEYVKAANRGDTVRMAQLEQGLMNELSDGCTVAYYLMLQQAMQQGPSAGDSPERGGGWFTIDNLPYYSPWSE